MKIAVIGTGYVGLVSGTCFAEWGNSVVCVDKNLDKIAGLNQGRLPIYEPGLDTLVQRNKDAGRLSFTSDLPTALKGAEVVFIAVGTPPRPGFGDADLSFVYMAAKEIALSLEGYAVVAVKSTVPVGTGDAVEKIIGTVRPHGSFSVVSNPEFLREGSAIDDFLFPDRVVVGVDDDAARMVMQALYRPLAEARTPVVVTQRRTSELIKYASNAFLATKITFINELADLCEQVGSDVTELALGVGLDHRIGGAFLNAGPGYGGSCFPKDTLALLKTAEDYQAPLRIVESVVKVNDARKRAMGRKVVQALGGEARGRTVALLGLTFKPNTDDMREAPSLSIVQALQDNGAIVRGYDPEGMNQARPLMPGVEFFDSPYLAAAGADAVVLVTEWDVLRALDLRRLARDMAQPLFVDLRSVYPPDEVEEAGLRWFGIGRPPRG